MDNKRKILISAVLILLAIIATAFILYFLFFKNTAEEVPPGGTFPEVPPFSTTTPQGGNNEEETPSGTSTEIPGFVTLPSGFKPILRQISTVPTAGGVVFEKNNQSMIRYIERGKGHVYETSAINVKKIRVSNNTIPQIYEALWKNNGENIIARFLRDNSTIQTFSAIVAPKTAGEGELRGEFLNSDIKSLALSPSGNQIFYLINNDTGSLGITSTIDGKNKLQIFDSPLREWLVDWPKENTVAINSKAGTTNKGLLMVIETATGKRDVLLSGINGLTSLVNSDISKTIYSESSENGGLTTKIFDIKTRSSNSFVLTTLPEKCVWSKIQKDVIYCAVPESIPTGNYPDDWYQGKNSFRDEIWKINTSNGDVLLLMNLGDVSKIDFDAINISISPKENFLIMINKNDLTLWELQIAP